jgi:hypothetical protein
MPDCVKNFNLKIYLFIYFFFCKIIQLLSDTIIYKMNNKKLHFCTHIGLKRY